MEKKPITRLENNMPRGVYKHKLHTEETKKKMSNSHIGTKWKNKRKKEWSNMQKEEKNNNWKGNNIKSIDVIHTRVEKKYGKLDYCENREENTLNFECSRKSNNYNWSNKKHDYKIPIKREDWQRLCHSCHIKYDYMLKRKEEQ